MLEAVPPILTIQLQRVSWINNALQKNNAKVVFDLDMALDRWVAQLFSWAMMSELFPLLLN